jgi:type I restriction enzyme S subunit
MGKAKYPKYKPSKTLWQEQIPSHWQETELRMLFADNKNKNIGLVERNLLSLSYGKLKRKDIDNATGLVPASFEGYQIIEKGYIVLRFTDLQNDKKSLRVGYANERGIITNAYVGLAPKADIHSKYFYYQLHFLDKIKYFYNLGGGVRQSLAFKEFGRETVLVPDINEQEKIANFLDFKLAKIERFIRKKKDLIKLLNEQKASIINKTITNGLNSKVKYRKSGIEWLGLIPEHWKLNKLKYSVRLNKHKSFDNHESSTVKIALENIEGKTGRILELSQSAFEGIGTIFKAGDVLFGKLRPYLAKVVSPDFEGSCVNEILVLSPNPTIWNSNFLKYRMLASDFIGIVDNSTYGAKMPRASWDFIGGLVISCPSLTEQEEIVLSIEQEHERLNKLIFKIESEISITEEYKTSIIAEAVTGKIDVRNYELHETTNETYEDIEEEELSIAAEEEVEYKNQETE